MKRREFLTLVCGIAAAWPVAASAQATKRVRRIGWITAQQAASLAPYIEAMRSGLADLGYVEGRNLNIEFRYGNDAVERVPELTAELVRLPVDLIVAQGAAVSVISKLRLSVPVVYVTSVDPVSAGFADSLARPLGNMTGLSMMAAEFNGKRLDLLREIAPDLRRVAIIANPEHPGQHLERSYSEETARRLGIAVDYFPTRTSEELTGALAVMAKNPPQAISLFADGFAVQNRQRLSDFAIGHGISLISGWSVFAKSGALCTYGPRLADTYRRLAYYVDRVLKGANPADLPIEQPTTFELVINLKTAKTLGITVPESILARADEVIE